MIRYCMELHTSLSYIKERISTNQYCREILSLVPSLLAGNMKMNAIIILSLLLKVAVSIERIPDADDSLHIYALPVGQGDCTVIQCPQGNGDPTKGVVTIIDAGASNSKGIDGQGIVDFLTGTELNFAVITHSHRDHWSYMDTILNYYGKTYKRETGNEKKFTVYHPCAWSSYGVMSKYAKPMKVHRCVGIEECEDYISELDLCPHLEVTGLTLYFIASAFGKCKNNKANNEDSIIAGLAGQVLITGDFELKDEDMKKFLQTAGDDLKSDIYKLSHHGAYDKKASQKKFLDAVSADFVFSSSGYMYGHPRRGIYNYYKNKLPDIVAKHPYTYYVNKDTAKNVETRKPIYVTSLIRKNWFDNWIKSYYLIKFNIDPYSNICVEFIHVNDETK